MRLDSKNRWCAQHHLHSNALIYHEKTPCLLTLFWLQQYQCLCCSSLLMYLQEAKAASQVAAGTAVTPSAAAKGKPAQTTPLTACAMTPTAAGQATQEPICRQSIFEFPAMPRQPTPDAAMLKRAPAPYPEFPASTTKAEQTAGDSEAEAGAHTAAPVPTKAQPPPPPPPPRGGFASSRASTRPASALAPARPTTAASGAPAQQAKVAPAGGIFSGTPAPAHSLLYPSSIVLLGRRAGAALLLTNCWSGPACIEFGSSLHGTKLNPMSVSGSHCTHEAMSWLKPTL